MVRSTTVRIALTIKKHTRGKKLNTEHKERSPNRVMVPGPQAARGVRDRVRRNRSSRWTIPSLLHSRVKTMYQAKKNVQVRLMVSGAQVARRVGDRVRRSRPSRWTCLTASWIHCSGGSKQTHGSDQVWLDANSLCSKGGPGLTLRLTQSRQASMFYRPCLLSLLAILFSVSWIHCWVGWFQTKHGSDEIIPTSELTVLRGQCWCRAVCTSLSPGFRLLSAIIFFTPWNLPVSWIHCWVGWFRTEPRLALTKS